MKRYWKFIVLSLFTVAILGGYYVKTSAKQNNGYAIALKNHSGDSEVVKDLTIQGDFTNLQTYNYTTFKLTNNQTSFENDLSYLKKLDGVFQDSPRLRNYVEVHHSFMRGKLRIPYLFSEDTEYLSYVNDETTYEGNGYTQELTISRLNKETNKIDEFTYALPNNTSEASYYVSDTFYKDEKVYALLQRSEYTENAQKDTYELFVWDFDSQKMIIEALNNKSISPSTARIEIYNYLSKDEIHPTGDEIYKDLMDAIPTLSKTTVYNTLNLFVKNKLIRAINL